MRVLEEATPLLYLHGPSTRRVRKALGKRLGKHGLSKTTVVRLPRRLVEAFASWRQRDLSLLPVIYLFLDRIRLGVPRGTREKEAVLVAHAVLADGRREVLAVALGSRESTRALYAPTLAQTEEALVLFERAYRERKALPLGSGVPAARPGGLLDLLLVSSQPLEADSDHQCPGAKL